MAMSGQRYRAVLWNVLTIVLAVTGTEAQPTVTVTMRLAEAEWHVVRQEVLPRFEVACNGRVRAIDVPPETLVQRLRAMHQAGRIEIDLLAQDNMRLQELINTALASPFTPEESQVEEAIYPSLMAVGVSGGMRYFLPFRPNVQIAYYNAEKFAQYHLQPPRTWPEILAVARTFYEKEQTGRMLFTGAGGAPTTTQLYEWIVAAGGHQFDFAHPGTVDTFRFLAALRPYLSSESRRAKWNTTNETLAQEGAYLAQNWPFGVLLLVQEYGKTTIRTYSGGAGPVREAHIIGGDVLGIPVGAPLSATGPHTNALSMRRYSVFCGAMRPPSRFSRLWPHAWMLYGSTRETLPSSGPGAPCPVPGAFTVVPVVSTLVLSFRTPEGDWGLGAFHALAAHY
jgi:trehalose transport system substrate-binding protein